MPILSIQVENADQLLNASYLGAGALGRVERSATGGGSGYSEFTTFALVSGTRLYTVYDLSGASSSWYRIRYSKSDGTSPSDYGDEFQSGDETAGLLCSLYDVSQRMFGSATVGNSDQEILLDIIRGVSNEIEEYVGAWLAPRPTNATSTATYRFDVEYYTTRLWLKQGNRHTGIRSITSANLATYSQPATGGSFTAATTADLLIRPQPTADGPGWRLELTDRPAGGFAMFYPGYNTVELTGTFGPAAVPYWAQEAAIAMVTRRFIGKESAATALATGPEGTIQLLPGLPPDQRLQLELHRFVPVA